MALLRVVIVHCCVLAACVLAQFNWHVRDNFDDIRMRIDKVRGDNCRVVDVNELFLPNETVTHVPNIQRLNIDPVFPNRTNLLHIHNMAISRAFFFRSFVPEEFAMRCRGTLGMAMFTLLKSEFTCGKELVWSFPKGSIDRPI